MMLKLLLSANMLMELMMNLLAMPLLRMMMLHLIMMMTVQHDPDANYGRGALHPQADPMVLA